MADSACFDIVCVALERETALDRLEARGTVRLLLKAAGLDARTVTPDQLGVAIDKLLPGELRTRGVENGAGICADLRAKLSGLESIGASNTPEAVFARLGGSA